MHVLNEQVAIMLKKCSDLIVDHVMTMEKYNLWLPLYVKKAKISAKQITSKLDVKDDATGFIS